MPDFVKLMAVLVMVACAEPAPAFPGGEAGEAGRVSAISGPLTLTLETASGALQVRLAELDAPDPAPANAWLAGHIEGRQVRLVYDGLRRDRYDRALAQAYLADDDSDNGGESDESEGAANSDTADAEHWVQAQLVSAGLARVLSHAGNREAATPLLALEDTARQAGLGLWADAANHIRDTHPDGLAQDVGSVQLVEGRVVEVTRLRSGRTYLNFGTDYRTDFTIVVEAADGESFDAAGLPLADLAGQRIRVRGWIEAENGPLMRIDHPERIELIGE